MESFDLELYVILVVLIEQREEKKRDESLVFILLSQMEPLIKSVQNNTYSFHWLSSLIKGHGRASSKHLKMELADTTKTQNKNGGPWFCELS